MPVLLPPHFFWLYSLVMEETEYPRLVHSGPERFEAGLTYRYQLPDSPGPHPTVIMLHGLFGNEDVMWVFRRAIPKPWLVIAPRAPIAERDGYSWIANALNEWPKLEAFDSAVATIERFIKAMPRLYNADPDRTWLMGFSQGAALSLAVALQRPGLICGLAAIVGFLPTPSTDNIDGRLAGLPLFMAVGTEDQMVPYAIAGASAGLLRRSGAELEYHEYHAGHKLTAAGIEDLRRWFTRR